MKGQNVDQFKRDLEMLLKLLSNPQDSEAFQQVLTASLLTIRDEVNIALGDMKDFQIGGSGDFKPRL